MTGRPVPRHVFDQQRVRQVAAGNLERVDADAPSSISTDGAVERRGDRHQAARTRLPQQRARTSSAGSSNCAKNCAQRRRLHVRRRRRLGDQQLVGVEHLQLDRPDAGVGAGVDEAVREVRVAVVVQPDLGDHPHRRARRDRLPGDFSRERHAVPPAGARPAPARRPDCRRPPSAARRPRAVPAARQPDRAQPGRGRAGDVLLGMIADEDGARRPRRPGGAAAAAKQTGAGLPPGACSCA